MSSNYLLLLKSHKEGPSCCGKAHHALIQDTLNTCHQWACAQTQDQRFASMSESFKESDGCEYSCWLAAQQLFLALLLPSCLACCHSWPLAHPLALTRLLGSLLPGLPAGLMRRRHIPGLACRALHQFLLPLGPQALPCCCSRATHCSCPLAKLLCWPHPRAFPRLHPCA